MNDTKPISVYEQVKRGEPGSVFWTERPPSVVTSAASRCNKRVETAVCKAFDAAMTPHRITRVTILRGGVA